MPIISLFQRYAQLFPVGDILPTANRLQRVPNSNLLGRFDLVPTMSGDP